MLSPLVAVADGGLPDVTEIPLEQLINTEFIPANRIANQVSNASSAVSIVTAQDIKDYGYRTLGDILDSMRGLQTPHDVQYGVLGGRGFSDPGSYAGRIIVLIDGYRADDGYFGQAYLGNDGILDVALIERVEFISGGGAVGYGDGALLGAINIITKKGGDINGAQLAAGYGSHRAHQERFTFGQTLKNGADILLSASTYNSHGRDFPIVDYETLAPMSMGRGNGEDNKRLFFKGAYEGFTLQTAWAKRRIDYPATSVTAVDIISKAARVSDDNAYVRLKYDTDLTQQTKLSSSIWYGQYLFRSSTTDELTPYAFGLSARWHGMDAKLVGLWFDRHTISLGAEYRYDFQWRWFETNKSIAEETPRHTYSLYAYDDFMLNNQLSLNFGVRYENSRNIHAFSPRGAIIWKPWESTVFKLTKGVSRRQPTGSESFRFNRPERADTEELVWEQQLAWQTKLLGSLYRYDIQKIDGASRIETRGAELEFEKIWESGARLRTSYAWQNAQDQLDRRLVNAPYNIIKFNLSKSLVGERLRMGLEVRHLGSRMLADLSQHTGAYTVADLTLNAPQVLPSVDASLTVRNLFDRHYGDVSYGSFDGTGLFPQDGRNLWLQLEYNLK